jgi:8-oxo-dGTP pyrophosphatase MutT (NUDIX family)
MRELLNKMKVLNENKNGKVVTFDFDNTIVKSYEESNDDVETIYQYGGKNPQIIARIKKFKQSGVTVLVVTSRKQHLEVPESSVSTMLKQLKIEVDGIFYTNGEKKAKRLHELGSSLHYDDDPAERFAIEEYKKLHPSDIIVKNPDDLLKDIDEISKGLIFTNDNKIIIAQRSDSLEWDAPGGHLVEGEEANFAFYREILEELSLKTKKIDYMSSLNTTWDGQDKLAHYFIGRIPYNSDQLDGVIQLQWEIADYFCGDLEEIELKMGEGATQNLKNSIDLLKQENLMLEMAYPHSGRHATKKRRLVGLGNNKNTGAKGLKRLKNFERSKSAPAGFGAMEEEGEKKRKKIKISIVSSIDERKRKRKKRKKRKSKGVGWPYGGYIGTIGSNDSDGGGDGGGGE